MKSHRSKQSGFALHGAANSPSRLLPSRNPVKPSGDTFRAKFRSRKSEHPVRCESLLELKATALLEFAKCINQYTHQPPKLRLCVDGKLRRYTPDFGTTRSDGRGYLLVEVKPEIKAKKPDMRKKFQAAKEAANQQGCGFVVVTERHLQRAGMADVLRLLKIQHDFVVENIEGPPIDESMGAIAESIWCENPALQRVFDSKPFVTMAEAVRVMGGGEDARWSLDVLLLARILTWPITQALKPSTRLHMYTEADDEQLFL